MELKPARSSYRRRQRSVFWRVLILLALVFIGGYIVYNSWWTETGPLPLSNTPTLAPTPTRSAVVWSASGDELYWSGNVSEAIVAYSEALALDPDQPALYVRLARLLTIFGRPERGLEMARAALRYNSEDPTAWVALCMAYDWLGFAQEAIPHCQRAVNLDPTYAEAYAYLAEAYIDDGQWFNANETIQIALTLDPNSVDVLRNYGYVLELQGNYTAALAAYQEGLLYHPGMAHLHLAIGRNAQVLGNYALAEESFLAATELDPGNAAAWDLLAWLYLLSGDYVQAQTSFERAIEVEPTYARAHARLGTLFFQRRNYEDAIPAFREGVRYGEARQRRRVVFFTVTLEDAGQIGEAPAGQTAFRAEFAHPYDFEMPLRAAVQPTEDYPYLQGMVRFNVMNGRYVIRLEGLPDPPPGKVYVGWFERLRTPAGAQVRTAPLVPTVGRVELTGSTGPVRGPAIETYYTLALCHYFLDECSEAQPYIDIALAIDPQDANAQQTWRLCNP